MQVTSVAAGAESRGLSSAGLVVLSLASLDLGLETGIVVPALPVLAAHYGASVVGVSWLVTGFLLASVVAMPLFGRLGDLFGKRLMLLVSLGAFAAGSLVCAVTHSIGPAIAGRVIQGLGAAAAPLALGLVRDTLEAERIARGIGVVVGAIAAGGATGMLVSGLLVEHFSAAAIFWFLFGLAGVLAIAVLALVPETSVRADVQVDLYGAVTLGVGLAALLLAISKGKEWGWWSTRTVGTFAASALLLVCFVIVERRVRQPLVDLGFVVARPFLNANVCTFAFGYSFLIAVLIIPLIAATPTVSGYGLGLSTIEIGLVLVPNGIVGLFSGWWSGRMVERIGPRALVSSGAAIGIAAYVWLVYLHGTRAELAAGVAVLGLGWGFVLTGIVSLVMRSATADKTTVALAVNAVIRFIAVSIGAQVAFAIVSGAGLVGPFPAESGYTRTFVMGIGGSALLLLASGFLPGRRTTTG